MIKHYSLITLFLVVASGYTQHLPGAQLKIKKAQDNIILDGVLDELSWRNADIADNWYQNSPVDSLPAPFQTEARLTFNDEFLYVSFVCYDDDTPDVVSTLRRDFDYPINDNVAIIFSPYNDKLNGYFFNLTPEGVQMEGIVANGGNGDNAFNIYWDNKWYSKVVRYKDKWIGEMAIPFKSFRYKSDINEWNITFDRLDKKRNVKSAWVRTPRQYYTGNFAYVGQLIWEDPIPTSKSNISVIPYISGGSFKDQEMNPSSSSSDLQGGFDAKIGITPSMNLDLTINPDFSQIEVDAQILNLSRFEFQFPERRQFFLENSDLFENAGFAASRPFFSRRIGIVQDTAGIAQKVPISYGARLSGMLNDKWRLGVMNMQTKEMKELGLPSQNYTVATVQRLFSEQSSFSLSFVNKESIGVEAKDSLKYFHQSIFRKNEMLNNQLDLNTFNRVLDANLVLRSKDNKWFHSASIAQSFDGQNKADRLSGSAFVQYSDPNINASIRTFFINKNFNPEVGFIPGRAVYPGQKGYYSDIAYKFYPKSAKILYTGPTAGINDTFLPDGTLVDREITAGYVFSFQNSTELSVEYANIFQHLTIDFNPIYGGSNNLFLRGEEFRWNSVSSSFQSDSGRSLN